MLDDRTSLPGFRALLLILAVVTLGHPALFLAEGLGLLPVDSVMPPGFDQQFPLALGGLISGLLLACTAVFPVPAVWRRWGSVASVPILWLTLVFSLTAPLLERSVPQAVWIPTLAAMLVLPRRVAIAVAVLSIGSLYAVHGPVGALGRSSSMLITVATGALLIGFRWLHDQVIEKAHEETRKAVFFAGHDTLTGLANRKLLIDLAEHAFGNPAEGHTIALIAVGIDGFKKLNDTQGHGTGDALLKSTASELTRLVGDSATVARYGGDEFVILLRTQRDDRAAERVALEIVERFREETAIRGAMVRHTVSVGVAWVPADAPSGEAGVERALAAMHDAKARGRNQVRLASESRHESAVRAFQLAQALRGAADRGELHVVYQPIVNLKTGVTRRAEVLVRWTHPTEGPVSPAEFIPIAESMGMVRDIDNWVFRRAARQAQAWRSGEFPEVVISINRSPVHFHADRRATSTSLSLLDEVGTEGRAISVEITEGILLEHDEEVAAQVGALRARGVTVALDDFGTGYSSLSRLHRIDLDVLKIDRAFVKELELGQRELLLCKAIIEMAHSLGLKVVAEGVETAGQRDILVQLGCDYGQGWLFGRPMSPHELELQMRRPPTPPLAARPPAA